MNELYISDSMIYFKTKANTCDEAMDDFLKKCVDAGIEITIEKAYLRNEGGLK